ncbi:MAG: hypothetical protein LBK25_08235 [Treponema sp.]|jgi:hypothetical protein|nr:hypothetical protein [Treponema sp.]
MEEAPNMKALEDDLKRLYDKLECLLRDIERNSKYVGVWQKLMDVRRFTRSSLLCVKECINFLNGE